jgi:hypothetical protein
MNKTRFTLRIGICTTVIGLAVLLALMTAQAGSIASVSFTAPANAISDVHVVGPFFIGPVEIRVSVPRAFKGTFYVFNYDGMRKLLTESVREPVLEENITGSTLIDFNMTSKGAYLIMVESHVSAETRGEVGLVQEPAIDQDQMWYSEVMITVGVGLSAAATILDRAQHLGLRRSKKPQKAA